MKLNVLNKNQQDESPKQMTAKEFWKLYLTIRPNDLTPKQIDIVSDFWSGTQPEKITGNYKTYVNKLEDKNIPLTKQTIKGNVTLQLNINVNEKLSQ